MPHLLGLRTLVLTEQPLTDRFFAHRGALSTIFLYFVDVEKSRKECAEFVLAEAKREAFADAVP